MVYIMPPVYSHLPYGPFKPPPTFLDIIRITYVIDNDICSIIHPIARLPLIITSIHIRPFLRGYLAIAIGILCGLVILNISCCVIN